MKNSEIKKLNLEGHKSTRQRQLILDVIRSKRGIHMTAEEIYNYVKKKDEKIGIATVYRNIKILEEEGILLKARFKEGTTACYELCEWSGSHTHHHLVCLRCGKVSDMEQDLLGTIEALVADTKGFKTTDHRLDFYGICGECQKETEPKG
ncbi:MAG: transcriptional repressor [Bacillota bacterium]|nr:transcriptional repressor [Bacillota bacterium]